VSAIPGGYDGDNSTITSVSSLQAIQQANALVSPPGAGMILPQSTHPGQNTQKNPQSPVSDISASPSPRKGAPRGPMGGGKGTADPSIGMGSSEIEVSMPCLCSRGYKDFLEALILTSAISASLPLSIHIFLTFHLLLLPSLSH
jgi:hypothetical protein